MAINKKDESKEVSNSVIRTKETDELVRSRDFLKCLLDFRRKKKLYDTYIVGVKDAMDYNEMDKIYLEYKIDGTVTGRLSNGGMQGSNSDRMGISFHTLPRDTEFNIRSYVVAPPGYKFITADMKAMELRVLAHLAKESNMAKAFREKIDLHFYSASLTFGKKMEEISKEERQIAKEVSFLTVYGGTEVTLAEKRGITQKKAKGIIDNWMAAFPGVPRYMKHVHDYIKRTGYAYTIFGRRRNLPNILSDFPGVRSEAERQGLNFTVQSASSDTLVCCLLGMKQEFLNRGIDARVVGTVHDSVEIICREDLVDEVVSIIYDQMVNYPYIKKHFGFEFSVPLEIDVEVGNSFGSGEKYEF